MFLVTGIVHHGHFHHHIRGVVKPFAINYRRQQRLSVSILIKHFNKFCDAAFAVKCFAVSATIFFFFTEVVDMNGYFSIEVSQFSQTALQNVFVVNVGSKDGCIWPELHPGAGFVGSADFSYCIFRNAD